MKYHVCRTSSLDEKESVRDLILYSSKHTRGCFLFIAASILADPNFTGELKERDVEEYEIYYEMCLSPIYQDIKKVTSIVAGLLQTKTE